MSISSLPQTNSKDRVLLKQLRVHLAGLSIPRLLHNLKFLTQSTLSQFTITHPISLMYLSISSSYTKFWPGNPERKRPPG